MVAPEPPKTQPQQRVVVFTHGDWRPRYAQQAIDRAVRMIQEAPKGHQHYARLRAARLLGGYVAGGLLTEAEATDALRTPTEAQAEDVKAAMQTIADGLAYGQEAPITLAALEANRDAYRTHHYYQRARTAPSIFTRPSTQEGQAWT
jgi:hypothetical protein